MKHFEDIRETVSKTYTRAVEQTPTSGKKCGCDPVPKGVVGILAGYKREALADLPADAVVNSFGCGNPVVLGEVREGDTVLDLGSGAGIDILLAAKLVGPTGRVIGVDMTPAMIERARRNSEEAGLRNIEVRQGIIEDLPVESGSIDFLISNCVINLSPEKSRVFTEIARVLKSGGRFSISDIVVEIMPDWVRDLTVLYSTCLTGAIRERDYLGGLRAAGLQDVAVRDRLVYEGDGLRGFLQSELAEGGSGCCGGGEALPREKVDDVLEALKGKVASIRVVGRKHGQP